MQAAIQPGDPVQVGPSSVFAEGAFDGPTRVGGNDQAADGRLLVTVRSDQKRPARPLEQLQLLLNAASGGCR